MKADRGLTIERMVKLGRVSRSGFYRFDEEAKPDRPQTWTYATPSNASLCSGPAMAGHASRLSFVGGAGR